MVESVIFTIIVLLLGAGVHRVVLLNHEASFERTTLNRSFLAHLGAGVLLLILYNFYFEGGDLNAYNYYGVPIADAMRSDFGTIFPAVVDLFLHRSFEVPLTVFGTGSTGTMQAIAVLLLFVLGNSQIAATVLISIASYLSKVLIYRSLQPEFPLAQHPTVLTAIMLSPSGIIWTCALLKEPILMIAIGPAFLAVRWLVDGRRFGLAVFILAVSGAVMVLVKPYVLLAFVLAAATWLVWARAIVGRGAQAIRPFYFALAFVAVSVGFSAVSAAVPSLSPDRLAESAQYQRRVSAREHGGSNFYLEDREAEPEEAPSTTSQIALVPAALVTALFRPFLFESFTAMQFLNAIEMTWLLVLFIQVFRRQPWRTVLRRATDNPALMFALVFTLVLALGTGLASANLGTLSRYRAPMMPFFLLLLLILRQVEEVKKVPESRTAPAPLAGRPHAG